MAEVAGEAAVALELGDGGRVAEFEERGRLQQLRLGQQFMVAGDASQVEHLGDDGKPFSGRADGPAGVVEGEKAEGKRGRVVELAGDRRGLGGDGTGPFVDGGVPAVMQLASQAGQRSGPQCGRMIRQDADGLLQETNGAVASQATQRPQLVDADGGAGEAVRVGELAG